jgi:hypothetical protein
MRKVTTVAKSKRKDKTGPVRAPFRNVALLVAVAGAIVLVGGGAYLLFGGSQSSNLREISLAPLSQMPAFVQTAPRTVQEAYRFAVANPELLDQMPCYCGCGGVGHDDNIDCYVKAFTPDGSVAEFDNHAAF